MSAEQVPTQGKTGSGGGKKAAASGATGAAQPQALAVATDTDHVMPKNNISGGGGDGAAANATVPTGGDRGKRNNPTIAADPASWDVDTVVTFIRQGNADGTWQAEFADLARKWQMSGALFISLLDNKPSELQAAASFYRPPFPTHLLMRVAELKILLQRSHASASAPGMTASSLRGRGGGGGAKHNEHTPQSPESKYDDLPGSFISADDYALLKDVYSRKFAGADLSIERRAPRHMSPRDVIEHLREKAEADAGSYRADSGKFRIHERDDVLQRVLGTANQNFSVQQEVNSKQHVFLVVPGGSGLGKTKVGFSAASHLGQHGFSTTSLFINFANGLGYLPTFDHDSNEPELRIGVRLAAAYLKVHLDQVFLQPAALWRQLTARRVLKCILEDAFSKSDDRVALVMHFDEFQMYIDAADGNNAVFKKMMDKIGEAMTGFQLSRKFALVPILTGTAVADIAFLPTEKYHVDPIFLNPLTVNGALAMARDIYGPEETVKLAANRQFRKAIASTAGVPKYLDHLFLSQPHEDMDWMGHLNTFNWGTDVVTKMGGAAVVRELVRLALSGHPVQRIMVLRAATKEKDALTIKDIERNGYIVLVPAPNAEDHVLVTMPFVQLNMLNNKLAGQGFPLDLLPQNDALWTWEQFERVLAHILALRVHMRTDSAVRGQRGRNARPVYCELQDVLPGAEGRTTTLETIVEIQRVKCYTETAQCLTRIAGQVKPAVGWVQGSAHDRRVKQLSIWEGVFLLAPNTALFDTRCFFKARGLFQKPVCLMIQTKHTISDERGDRNVTTVRYETIQNWLAHARRSMRRHWKPYYNVVFVWVTNKKLTGKPENQAIPPDLLIVSADTLQQFVGLALWSCSHLVEQPVLSM